MEDVQCMRFEPNNFQPSRHFYPKALNASLHSMVRNFFRLNTEQMIERYCHLHPEVDRQVLENVLRFRTRYFYWGGADLFYVATEQGRRGMVLIETNSCPSGQKSMPAIDAQDEHRGYRVLLETAFLPRLRQKRLVEGALGILYDKNEMEASGYAQTLADLTAEPVYMIPMFDGMTDRWRFENGILQANFQGQWIPIRAALRYVTQKPWNRIPVKTRTFIFNPVIVCLSGGRNKLVASKAYELFDSELVGSGLAIRVPETIRDVSRSELRLWLEKFSGKGVIKVPYGNAGQGVYTITNEAEFLAFESNDIAYDQFIVQSLIGHYAWSSKTAKGQFFHIGTMPDKKNRIFVSDLRMMVASGIEGMRPIAAFARRARQPLRASIDGQDSWQMLGTNLSERTLEGGWSSDSDRLMLLDDMDFNKLGIAIDDLIEAFIQTCLSIIAIDKMAARLINKEGTLRRTLFRSVNNDPQLISEILE